MYDAEVDGVEERLVFQVSGMLWNRSLVMRDLKTGSLWSHHLGEAMKGELKGKKLVGIPSVIASWQDWKEQHPTTTVLNLSRSAKRFFTRVYEPKQKYVIGVEAGDTTKAWRYDFLAKKEVWEDEVGALKVLLFFDQESSAVQVFNRLHDGVELQFREKLQEGRLVSEDGTTWDVWDGQAMSGPLQGQRLERVYGLPSFRKSWQDFHPKGPIVE